MTESPLKLIKKIDKLRGIFLCFCGKEIQRHIWDVKNRRTISCGCLKTKKYEDKAKELIGKTVNGFLVIDYVGKIKNNLITYQVKCPYCPKVFLSTKCNFTTQISCGCLNTKEIKINEVYGLYKVIEILQNKKCKVFCQDCGNEKILLSSYLKKIKSTRCLCFSKFNKNNNKETSHIRTVFNKTANAVEKRGRLFELDFETFKTLMLSDCYYCDSSPTLYSKGYKRNGIDRVNSEEGYVIGNVVPCCYNCNIMKNDLSLTTFLNHINKINQKWGKNVKKIVNKKSKS